MITWKNISHRMPAFFLQLIVPDSPVHVKWKMDSIVIVWAVAPAFPAAPLFCGPRPEGGLSRERRCFSNGFGDVDMQQF